MTTEDRLPSDYINKSSECGAFAGPQRRALIVVAVKDNTVVGEVPACYN